MKCRCQHQPQIFYKFICIGAISFIHYKNIGDLHQACLHGLHFIAGFRNNYNNRYISKPRNFNFTLTNTNGFNDD